MINKVFIARPSGNGYVGYEGLTVRLFAYSTGTSGYTGSALYTYTDANDGNYYADVTTTIKGTLVVTYPSTTTVTVPAWYKGAVYWGDNILTIAPGGTS